MDIRRMVVVAGLVCALACSTTHKTEDARGPGLGQQNPSSTGLGGASGGGSNAGSGGLDAGGAGGHGGATPDAGIDSGLRCDPDEFHLQPCKLDAGHDAGMKVSDAGMPIDKCPDQPPPGRKTVPDPACMNTVATGTFTPVLKWKLAMFDDAGSNEIMAAPIVANLNDDNKDGKIDDGDIPDIVVVTYGGSTQYGVLRAVSGDGKGVLWSVSSVELQFTGGAAAGDIDGDGLVEIVSLTADGAAAFENDGKVKWTAPHLLTGHINGTSDVPAISDMDHDGKPEIIAGNAILNADGTLRGAGAYGKGGVTSNVGTCAFATDLDHDGVEEVITGNAIYRPDGGAIWHKDELKDGYPAVADLDGDGLGEIAVSGDGELRIVDTDGTLLKSVPIPGADQTMYGGPPTIADFDGDGKPEIGVAAGSRYSVIEVDGTILWQATTDDSSSGNTGSSVFDFEGDGAAEVVYADQTRLWVFNGADGKVKLESPEHSNGTWLEYPVVADVDADGHAEIVVVNTTGYGNVVGLTVFGDKDNSWMPGRRIWNQYAYSITNVNDDGTIPKTAASNWPLYNSFRSGDVRGAGGLKASDLSLLRGSLCASECANDKLTLWLHPGNLGTQDVLESAKTTIKVFGKKGDQETLLTTTIVKGTLSAGAWADGLAIVIEGKAVAGFDALVARIASGVSECRRDNNELVIDGPLCPPKP